MPLRAAIDDEPDRPPRSPRWSHTRVLRYDSLTIGLKEQLILDRPDKRNALTRAMWAAIPA